MFCWNCPCTATGPVTGAVHVTAVARDVEAVKSIARTFALAPGALIEASFRFHRVERDYEYSYRILGVVRARARLK